MKRHESERHTWLICRALDHHHEADFPETANSETWCSPTWKTTDKSSLMVMS